MTEQLFTLVDNHHSWIECIHALKQASRIAVDIEANSLYAYREKVCLIQISTDHHDYIVDPLADFSIDELGVLLADPALEKVFHAADYDLSLLKGMRGWEVNNLFDTMWAGRILGFSQMGLAWFLETLYEVKLSKKCQKADWGRRPLSQEKLVYARNDTRYLLRLRDELDAQLQEAGMEEEAREIFEGQCRVEGTNRVFDPDDFWRLKGVRSMEPRSQAILKALFVFRDKEAKRRDVPPFKVLNNQVLFALTHHAAQWKEPPPAVLESVQGVPTKLLERMKPHLMKTIKTGLDAPIPQRPVRQSNAPSGYWKRHEALMTWRKEAARERGVESDVILGRKALEEIAQKGPENEKELAEITLLGPWRRKQYGTIILGVVT
ncbi:MAG: HRDC domain-containing protein [Candidatus Hydrogenedentes bacterium]|nr:HRDC domain-containing protein [Candidatus Hydrogenedentota bacterium]